MRTREGLPPEFVHANSSKPGELIELGLIEKARAAKPIFLLDDVFSELDGQRRQSLVASLKDYQTIITTTDAEAVLEYFATGHQNLITLG